MTILDIYSTVAGEVLGKPQAVVYPLVQAAAESHGLKLGVVVPEAEVARCLAELRSNKLALVLWLGQWAEHAPQTMTPADKAQLRLHIQARQN
jgi:hypothetical protein